MGMASRQAILQPDSHPAMPMQSPGAASYFFTQLIAGGIAAVLVIAFLVTWVPGYFRDRHLDQLISTIESGPDAEIAIVIEELQADLTNEEQSRVYRDNDTSRQALIDYFQRNIADSIDPSINAYDYQRAKSLIEQMLVLFPDSAVVAQIRDNIEERSTS